MVKEERLEAKATKNKLKDTFLKLILNSISGLLDMSHSWLYFPQGALRLRLIGQLFLTKAVEVCIMNNWQVISTNTDGIEVIVPKDECERYEKVLCQVAEDFNLIFEHEDYKFINYKNVNNYIALTNENKVKRKGLFLLDYNEDGKRENPLGKSCNEFIVAKALNAYFVHGISPREYITNHEKFPKHIYDFCRSDKVDKTYTVVHNNQEQQRLNRYYFSKTGPYLYKRKKDKTKLENMNVGKGVILLNEFKDLPLEDYNINYDIYIFSTQKIIDEMNNYNQLTLF